MADHHYKPHDLSNAAGAWPTPRTVDSHGAGYQYDHGDHDLPRPSLVGRARNWQTPNAAAEAPNLGSNIKHGPKSLLAQAEWATPTVGNTTGGNKNRGGDRSDELLLPCQASGLLDRMTQTAGDESSPSAPTSRRRLNPRFVEWLMGWPEGAVTRCLAPANCTC